jgi:hypothetical protein
VGHDLGGDTELGDPGVDQLGDLRRAAGVEFERHAREPLDELLDHRRKGIARDGVGHRERDLADERVAMLLRGLPERFDLDQGALGVLDDGLARRRDPGQLAPGALEDLHPELVLELADLLAHPRL